MPRKKNKRKDIQAAKRTKAEPPKRNIPVGRLGHVLPGSSPAALALALVHAGITGKKEC